jgi:hypothetical protein
MGCIVSLLLDRHSISFSASSGCFRDFLGLLFIDTHASLQDRGLFDGRATLAWCGGWVQGQ